MKVKAPYVPPKSTAINMAIAEKQIKANVPVIEEVARNIPVNQKRVNDRKPTIANWDQGF